MPEIKLVSMAGTFAERWKKAYCVETQDELRWKKIVRNNERINTMDVYAKLCKLGDRPTVEQLEEATGLKRSPYGDVPFSGKCSSCNMIDYWFVMPAWGSEFCVKCVTKMAGLFKIDPVDPFADALEEKGFADAAKFLEANFGQPGDISGLQTDKLDKTDTAE